MNRLFAPPPASPEPAQAGGEVMGVLERITFHNPDNGYTVGKLKTERLGEEVRDGQAIGQLSVKF